MSGINSNDSNSRQFSRLNVRHAGHSNRSFAGDGTLEYPDYLILLGFTQPPPTEVAE